MNRISRKLLASLGSAVLLGTAAAGAQAQLYTSNIGTLIPGYFQNDDSTFAPISLGFSVNFFGTTYDSIYANNNGNVTFGASTSNYSPSPLNAQDVQPMIAPFWTDLDSRGGSAASGVYFSQTANQTVVTWNELGYYSGNYSGLVTFQLVLNNPGVPAAVGEGTIGFFYGAMSSGTDGHSVQAGFGDGSTTVNDGEIAYAGGSSFETTAQLNNSHVWFDLNGGTPVVTPPVVAVPEPGTYALMLAGMAAVGGVARRRRAQGAIDAI